MQCTSERDNDSSGARQKNGCKKREKTGVNYECENRGGGRDTERSQQGGPVVVVFCKVHTLHRYNVIWDGKKTTTQTPTGDSDGNKNFGRGMKAKKCNSDDDLCVCV